MNRSLFSSYVSGPLVAFLILTSGCSTLPVISKIMYQDTDRLVRLDVTYRTGAQEHSHPVNLTPADLRAVLRVIEVSPGSPLPFDNVGTNHSDPEQAFSDVQVEFLAPWISQALSQATPLEKVVFYLNEPYKGSIREITSGSLYMQSEDLHIIFSNYRQHTVGGAEAERVKTNPLVILDEPWYDLNPGPFGSVVDTTKWERLTGHDYLHLTIANPSKIQSTQMERKGKSETSIFDKLQVLRELRDNGLVTEEEFQKKKRQILDAF